MVREVLRYPDARLKRPARPVARLEDAARIAEDLVDTMRSFRRCVGIAAPQIAEGVRMCAIDCTGHPKVADPHGLLVLVNPAVTMTSAEEAVGREGCLSIPDLTGDVRRPVAMTLEASDPAGAAVTVQATGFEARVILHELDHLDGVLFLDRVRSAADVFARKRYA